MTTSGPELDHADTLSARIAFILDPLGGHTAIAASRIAAASARRLPTVPASADGAPAPDASGDDPRSHAHPAGDTVLIRADALVPAASLAKLPIAVELLRRVDLGQFDLSERFDTTAEPRVGGGGVLDYLDPTTHLTLGDLCYLMLGVSDNTAANFLLDLVGMGEVNETASRLNLAHTKLARRFMDFVARAAHHDNMTCAADMHTLLGLIRSGALPGAHRLRDMLAAQQLGEDVVLRLPTTARLAHKTGTLEDLFHDAGILSGPGGTCVFCVLTAAQSDVPVARAAVGAVVRVLWDTWCNG
jgi:beta-lactamase class A